MVAAHVPAGCNSSSVGGGRRIDLASRALGVEDVESLDSVNVAANGAAELAELENCAVRRAAELGEQDLTVLVEEAWNACAGHGGMSVSRFRGREC